MNINSLINIFKNAFEPTPKSELKNRFINNAEIYHKVQNGLTFNGLQQRQVFDIEQYPEHIERYKKQYEKSLKVLLKHDPNARNDLDVMDAIDNADNAISEAGVLLEKIDRNEEEIQLLESITNNPDKKRSQHARDQIASCELKIKNLHFLLKTHHQNVNSYDRPYSLDQDAEDDHLTA